MILAWMLYASAVTLLLGLGAWALEGVVRQRGWPVRWLWIGAFVGPLLLPVVVRLAPPAAVVGVPPTSGAVQPVVETLSQAGPVTRDELPAPLAAVANTSRPSLDVDAWLLWAWAVASAVLTAGLVLSCRALARRRRGWATRDVDGRTVWVSSDLGPAVAGVLRGRIVLPEWLMSAPRPERLLALEHEEEHVRARDPALLVGARVASIAMPWNLPLWWVGQRLRRAVEIDCDLRVLARGADPRAYSRLLIEVMDRGGAHRLIVAARSESPSFLERRINLMLARHSRISRTRVSVATLAATGCVLTACSIELPSLPGGPSPGVSVLALSATGPAVTQGSSAIAAGRTHIELSSLSGKLSPGMAALAPSAGAEPAVAQGSSAVASGRTRIDLAPVPGGPSAGRPTIALPATESAAAAKGFQWLFPAPSREQPVKVHVTGARRVQVTITGGEGWRGDADGVVTYRGIPGREYLTPANIYIPPNVPVRIRLQAIVAGQVVEAEVTSPTDPEITTIGGPVIVLERERAESPLMLVQSQRAGVRRRQSAPTPLSAQGECALVQSQSVNWVEIARGLRQITVFGPLLVQCPGGTELRSDFAVINQMTNEVQLNGNVSFVDSSHTLTSSNAAYNSATGRLYATGNVVLARKTDGYTIRVPELEYFSRQPGRE